MNAETTSAHIVDEALIAEIVHRIVDAVNPRRIVLFGSRARGNARADSDIDLFVEMESDEPRWLRRKLLDSLFPDRWWPMDLLVLTPQEVRAWGTSLATILPTISREGRTLYERPNS